MAIELMRIACETMPAIVLSVQTLPLENASSAVLRKIGFALIGELEHPDEGKIWTWWYAAYRAA